MQCVPGHFPGVEWPGCEVNHTSPSSAEAETYMLPDVDRENFLHRTQLSSIFATVKKLSRVIL